LVPTTIDELRSRALRGAVQLPLSVLLGFVLVLGIAPPAFATFPCGSFVGSDVDFLGVQETASFGGSEPLACSGSIVASGNSLILSPATFSATSAGGGIAQNGSQLQATIVASGATTIDRILITELGGIDLSGAGTGATGSLVSMSGFVTVTHTTAGPIAPVVIHFIGTFDQSLFGLPGDSGSTLWSGSASIDVASVVANATKATLSFDNDLVAASEDGTTSLIQEMSGPIRITVVAAPRVARLDEHRVAGRPAPEVRQSPKEFPPRINPGAGGPRHA
jgi:hypothetical protein